MSLAIEETVLDQVMIDMGYKRRESADGMVRYHDDRTPDADHLVFDFGQGPLPVEDVERTLQYHGVDLEVFYSQLEAMGLWPSPGGDPRSRSASCEV